MGFLDDAKDKAEDMKDDVDDKYHELKGRIKEKKDDADLDENKDWDPNDDVDLSDATPERDPSLVGSNR
jgi:hypothetical protein